jgi:hypothetical protein
MPGRPGCQAAHAFRDAARDAPGPGTISPKPRSAGEARASYCLRTNRVGAIASPAPLHYPSTRGGNAGGGFRHAFDGASLAAASRLVAKVDSAAVQDGFELYLHGFIVANDGKWVVVQQGMKGESGTARRYHWRSDGLRSFVEAPHSAIDGRTEGNITNLTDLRAAQNRIAQVRMLEALGPHRIVKEAEKLGWSSKPPAPAPEESDEPLLPHLVMPEHHDIRPKDVMLRRLHGSLEAAADRSSPAKRGRGFESVPQARSLQWSDLR